MQIRIANIIRGTLIGNTMSVLTRYISRVVNGGGIVEKPQCVETALNSQSILQQASLLVVPSGYKGGTLYSEIPTNGNGDLTWTRGGDAFRTNASGVLQRVPWNLVQYSEQFNNAFHFPFNLNAFGSGSVANTTATVDPNGSNFADYIQENTSASVQHSIIDIFSGNVSGTTYTWSVFAKAAQRTIIQLANNGGGGGQANYNLTTGVASLSSGVSASMQDVGNGWYRCVLSYTSNTTGNHNVQIRLCDASGNSTYTGNGTSGVYIWGAQLVEGTTAQTYLPTTDRLNFPRLSYMYGSCPSVLLEPQRTNLAQNSGFVGTGSAPTNWTQPGGTGTSSLTTSNLGVGVQACSQSATAQRPFLQQDFTVSANTTYTFSMYVESISGTINYYNIMFITNPPVGATTSYFLDGVAVNEVTQATTGRLSIRLVVGALTGTISLRCGLGVSSTVTGSILFSRPQLEVGAYTTTFILSPVSASATRVADSFSRSNIYTNGLISASGGTWFVEFRNNVAYLGDAAGDNIILGVSTLVSDNCIRFNSPFSSSSRIAIAKRIGGVTTVLYTTTTNTCKIAIKWDGSVLDIFENGVKVVSGSSFTEKNMEFLSNGSNAAPKFIQQMALFPTPLTDAQCQTLTT